MTKPHPGTRRANLGVKPPTCRLPLNKARPAQSHQAGPTSLSRDTGHEDVQRWDLPEGWVICRKPALTADVLWLATT
jgi:hypothetical protein